MDACLTASDHESNWAASDAHHGYLEGHEEHLGTIEDEIAALEVKIGALEAEANEAAAAA